MVRGLGHHCVVQVSTGASHTLCLSNSGDLFAFGDNSHGQLGLGSKALGNVLTPRRIDFLKGLPIRAISCGAQHSVAVSWSGAVYAWGKNSYGQLGFGTNEDSSLPKEVQYAFLSLMLGAAESYGNCQIADMQCPKSHGDPCGLWLRPHRSVDSRRGCLHLRRR